MGAGKEILQRPGRAAINEGLIEGPRIWPSGAMISQTSGYGEYGHSISLPGSVMREAPPALCPPKHGTPDWIEIPGGLG
jgi:hypothetical protein